MVKFAGGAITINICVIVFILCVNLIWDATNQV